MVFVFLLMYFCNIIPSDSTHVTANYMVLSFLTASQYSIMYLNYTNFCVVVGSIPSGAQALFSGLSPGRVQETICGKLDGNQCKASTLSTVVALQPTFF